MPAAHRLDRGGISLQVYDVGAYLIRRLYDGRKDPGRHTVVWEGCDDLGREAGAGLYFVKMNTGNTGLEEDLVDQIGAISWKYMFMIFSIELDLVQSVGN
jgi:hypothetical protein